MIFGVNVWHMRRVLHCAPEGGLGFALNIEYIPDIPIDLQSYKNYLLYYYNSQIIYSKNANLRWNVYPIIMHWQKYLPDG